jgi:hypothetical protein
MGRRDANGNTTGLKRLAGLLDGQSDNGLLLLSPERVGCLWISSRMEPGKKAGQHQRKGPPPLKGGVSALDRASGPVVRVSALPLIAQTRLLLRKYGAAV